MKTPVRLRLRVVAALAFTVAAGVVWWVSSRARGTLRLQDGRQVTVLAVSYGTNHTLIEGPMWARVARRFISRPKAHRLGLRIYEQRFIEPTLVIWTHWRLPSTNGAPRYASLRDRHGVESEPQSVAVDAPVGTTGTAIMAWKFTNFPRRQRAFPLRFYARESGRLRLLGETPVSNVVRPIAASGNAVSPPITVKQDGIEFSLAMLRNGAEVATNLIRPNVQVAAWTEARFEVRQRGLLATNWTVRYLRTVGESGNRFQLFQPAVLSTNGDFRVAFPEVLWRDEPGWRFSAEFAHTSEFIETNRWTLKSVPVIWNQSAFTTNVGHDVPGVRIDTVEVRPTTRLQRYVRGRFRRTTDATVTYTPATERLHVDLAAATDDLGRPIRFGGGTELWKGKYVVGLEVPTNSTTLDLTFVVHQGLEVEFFVKPDWVTTNTVLR